MGAALDADEVILRKSVDGVMSTDPRVVATAKTLTYLSFDEAQESGKVVCTKAVNWLRYHPLLSMAVRSITNPYRQTRIERTVSTHDGVKIISFIKETLLLSITSDAMTQV